MARPCGRQTVSTWEKWRERFWADGRKQAASAWFQSLQSRIIASFEALERREDAVLASPDAQPGVFALTLWQRTNHDGAPGGGGRMGLLKGRVFEKAGIHCSAVHGTFAPEFAKNMPGAAEDPRFWAAGVSLIAHPWNRIFPPCT